MTAPSPDALAVRIRERNRRRSWLLRVPILLWMAYLLLRFLRAPSRPSLWGGINLALHEIGHVLFIPFPELWTVAGGTLVEMALPLVAAALFLHRREDFGACLALFWFATVLLGAAVYAGDARAQVLPLVSPFAGDPLHDWNFLLERLGLLDRDRAIAGALRGAGFLFMAGSVGLGAWVVGLMATDPKRQGQDPARVAGESELEAEGRRFRAWLAAREGGTAGRSGTPGTSGRAGEGARGPARGGEPPEASAIPGGPDRPPNPVRDPVDPSTLTPEERRFLEFLDRKEGKD